MDPVMKPSTLISLLALVLSVIALCLVLESRSGKVPQSQIDEQVDIALAKKERELVIEFRPRFAAVYEELLDGARYFEKEPETFAELFRPMVMIIQDMTGE